MNPKHYPPGMKILGLRFEGVDDVALERHRADGLTYGHVGSTLDASQYPHGLARQEERRSIGTGQAAFEAAKVALRVWSPQRAVGASVQPPGIRPDLGETVVLRLGIGPVQLSVPNRIVAVVDEPDRYGYAYGTLPGHPACGEELFLIERVANDHVIFTIRVDAKVADDLRMLAFVITPVQRIALRRYLSAVAGYVRKSARSPWSTGPAVRPGPPGRQAAATWHRSGGRSQRKALR